MRIKQRLIQIVGNRFLETMGQRHSLAEHVVLLENATEPITERIAVIGDSHQNRLVMGHVIGIEKWGQRRLKVALGEPFVMDEYNSYRPHHSYDITKLRGEFQTMRTQTLDIARQLATAKIDKSVKIPHNMYGDLSVYGWLFYLRLHASTESKRVDRTPNQT